MSKSIVKVFLLIFVLRLLQWMRGGHLVAMPFAAVKDAWGKYSEDIIVYVWKNGIDKAPEAIMQHKLANGLNGATLSALSATISVRGDMTKGDAVLGTVAPFDLRYVMLHFKMVYTKTYRLNGVVLVMLSLVYIVWHKLLLYLLLLHRNMIILEITHGLVVEETSSMFLMKVLLCRLISLCQRNILE